MKSLHDYLKATSLCDFDQASEIETTARRLTEGAAKDKRSQFSRLYQFVKEIRYALDDWDVKASATLRSGRGMCSGKTNLLVAMSRCLQIPARYKIYKIMPESKLWEWIASQDQELARWMGQPSPEQHHVVAEVYLDSWETYDTTRDPALEAGLKRLGMPLDRLPIYERDGSLKLDILASFDDWAHHRQEIRRFRENRHELFSRINEQLDKIRALSGAIPE